MVAIVGAAQVGEHRGVEAEGERIVTHLFDCADPAYTGWRWAVTVTRAPRSKLVTVNETVLLPGPGALLAPDWVPWHDRLRPGDLGVGDLLPAPPDDGRVVSSDHGCGAHSESLADAEAARTVAPVIDEFGYDLVDLPGVSVEETVFEPLSRGAD